MKFLPRIYLVALLLLIVFLFFVGAWAIAENAVGDIPAAEAAGGNAEPGGTAEGDSLTWYQDAAVFICPLH
jgi:hypothetical protein